MQSCKRPQRDEFNSFISYILQLDNFSTVSKLVVTISPTSDPPSDCNGDVNVMFQRITSLYGPTIIIHDQCYLIKYISKLLAILFVTSIWFLEQSIS